MSDKPKPNRRRRELKFRVHRIVQRPSKQEVPTVYDIACELHHSVEQLEIMEGPIAPHTLLDDAYTMAGMLVEAHGVEPHEALLDSIVFQYLKIRQNYMLLFTNNFYTKE